MSRANPTPKEAVGQPTLMVHVQGSDEYTIASSPIPLVKVRLFKAGGIWYYEDLTIVLAGITRVNPTRKYTSPKGAERYFHDSLHMATEYVVRLAMYRFSQEYTGPQRYAMGHQECPFRLGRTLCRATPLIGSVWCKDHRFGKAIAR